MHLPSAQKGLNRDPHELSTRSAESLSAPVLPHGCTILDWNGGLEHRPDYSSRPWWRRQKMRRDWPAAHTRRAGAKLGTARSTACPAWRVGSRYNWLSVESSRVSESNLWKTIALTRDGAVYFCQRLPQLPAAAQLLDQRLCRRKV